MDRDAATRQAHTLKGVAGAIGANGVQDAAAALEAACKDEQATADGLEGLLRQVTDALAPVLDGLASLDDPAPEQPDAVASGDRTSRLAEAQVLLPQLRQALDTYDSDAQALFAQLKACVPGPAFRPQLKQLEQSLSDYDFDGALAHLAAIAQMLEAQTEPKEAPGRLRDARRKAIEAAEQTGVADAIPS